MIRNGERDVFVNIDQVIVAPPMNEDGFITFKIVLSHGSQVSKDIIEYNTENVTQALNIRSNFRTTSQTKENPLLINVFSYYYGEKTLFISEKIDISLNVVGSLNYVQDGLSVTFIFRIIVNRIAEVVIYDVPQFQHSDFQVVRELGSGRYGKTLEVTNKAGESRALKIIYRTIDINDRNDPSIREILPLIVRPRHPCLIKLEGFIYDKRKKIILVLELATLGRIDTIDFSKLCDDVKIKIFYGLFSCVAFLHEHGIIHRDICPSNVLVTENYETRLIDFSVSRFIDIVMTQDQGHVGYKSPEMESSSHYDEYADDFSIWKILMNLYNNVGDKVIRAFSCLYNFDNTDIFSKVSCSEMCLIIENEIFTKNTVENERYFSFLSNYHDSMPIGLDTLLRCYTFQFHVMRSVDACDLIKLIVNSLQNGNSIVDLYEYFISYCKGIAIDTEHFDPDKCTFNFNNGFFDAAIPSGFISIDKIGLYFHHLLGGYYAKEVEPEELMNLLPFYILDYYSDDLSGKKSYISSLMNHSFCFESFIEKEKFDLIEDLTLISKFYNQPELIDTFLLILDGFNIINNSTDDIDLLENMAKSKNLTACEILGQNCCRVKVDNAEKYKYYAEIAYRNGRFKAAGSIADYFMKKGNKEEAMKYYEIGAKFGNKSSINMIGLCNLFGDSTENAIDMMTKMANEGDSMSQGTLAFMYFFGSNVPRNFSQAYYYNINALNQGDPMAYFLDGIFNFFGIVVKQDLRRARASLEELDKSVTNFDSKSEVKELYQYFKRAPNNQLTIYEISLLFLSAIYHFGLDCDVDFEKSKKTLLKIDLEKLTENSKIYLFLYKMLSINLYGGLSMMEDDYKFSDIWYDLYKMAIDILWSIMFWDLENPYPIDDDDDDSE